MPRPTNKPPPAEWERLKEVVLSLAIKHSWRDVAEKMELEHNFVAIPDHYDAQMRAWGVHKNLKSHEWRGAIEQLDKLTSRHQRKTRMRILGKIVPEDRLRRSRSRYCYKDPVDSGVVPSHVSFEAVGADGEWSACILGEEDNAATATSELPVSDPIQPESLPEDTDQHSKQRVEMRAFAPANQIPDLAISLPPVGITPDLDLSAIEIPRDDGLNPQLGLAFETDQHTDFEIGDYFAVSPVIFDFGQFYRDALQDLPFQRFQNALKIKGIDLRSLRPQAAAIRTFGASEFATPFMRDIASYIDPSTRVGQRIKYFQPSISLLAFQSLLPGEVSQEQYQYNLNSTATNAILETNFTQLLVFSMTNGLAGLRDMPIAGVFKFLKRYGSVSAVFGQILQASPRYVAKSLAENLFKVAIEAKESDIVMQLLRTPFVKANQIIFHVKGCRLTVAERSAQLRDLKTLEILLQAGADVNRTFKKDPIHGGVLKHLVSSIRRGETVPDVIHMIQTLLQAGAKVYAGMLRHVVEQLRHSHLALCLLPSLLPTHDTDLVSNGIMPLITLELDEEEACEATHQILTVCNLYHSRRCFEESESEIEWTLIESAKRGHSQVVRELLPYSRSLHRVLSASFRGGEREIIDMILARHSDFSSPAHSIEYSPIERALSRSGSDYAIGINHEPLPEPNKSPTLDETTPLAEAIMTTADDIIQICETAGALDHIRLDGHFRAALTAAAITGNLPYVRKLLQHGPSPSYDYYSVISTALSQSIKHGHDDITFELFQEGAVMGAGSNNILLAAFKARNAAIAHVMLTKYAVRRSTVNLAELFEEAIRWGDRSIIMDLHHIYAEYTIKRSSSFEKPMKATSESLLNFLVDLNLVENSALTQFLAAPIKTGDSAMVSRLMDLGAEPSDSANLHLAAIHHSGILKILLEHIPRSGKPCTNLGTYAVMQTVRLGFAGLESLEILLSSEVVDFRSFAYKFHDKDQRNPLGWAIEGAVYYNGGFPVVKRLLEAGCDPNSIVATPDYNSSTDCNMTALLAAICTRIVGVVGLLLTFGADVNTQATRGLTRTPLQLAAELGCLEIVQLLIEEGAHVNALPTQRRGGTSLQLAAISGNCNIAAELLSHGADPEAPPSFIDGRWPIEGAAEHGRLDMIEYLLKVTVYNEEKCERAMELARKNGHMGCHDLIAEHVEKQKSRGQNDLMSLDCTIAPFLV